jgi:hypothetical protein
MTDDKTTPISFEEHIKPLFRESDRQAMRFLFDLWSRDDVATHADRILSAVRSGAMPCDETWPPDRVERLQQWVDSGGQS